MKKIYSFALIIAAVLSSLTSCKKDSLTPEDETPAEGPTSFVAYLEDTETKTTIDGLKIYWKDGDQINVNGSIYEATADKEDPRKALFKLAEGQTAPKAASTYRAYYPASAFIGASYTQRYKLQETQTYNGNDVSSIDYLYGQSAGPEIPASFTFKHVTGILALDLVGEEKVTSIQITAPTNNYLYGTIANLSYSSAGKIAYSSFTTTDRGTTVTLDCGDGVQLNKTTPRRFYISLPEKTYPSLEIKINTASGKSKIINSTKSCPVTKGKLFTLPQIKAYNWVKMGVGTLTEPFTTMFGEDALVINVDVYQDSNHPGLYMYKGVGLQLANWYYAQDMSAYKGTYWNDEGIIFDATDPDKVVIEKQSYGFYAGEDYGWPVIATVVSGQTVGYGKLADGHLTLTAREYVVGWGTKYYYGPAGYDLALPSAATYVAPSKVNYVEKGERSVSTIVSAPASAKEAISHVADVKP